MGTSTGSAVVVYIQGGVKALARKLLLTASASPPLPRLLPLPQRGV
jgi:hypothetical protein